MRLDNFARSDACAKRGLPNCRGDSPAVNDEIAQAYGMKLHPSLITLTVGADDVNFKACFAQVVGIPSNPPCANSQSNLSAIEANIADDLTTLAHDFPRTRTYVTTYYDPLPANLASITNKMSPCSNAPLLYALSSTRTDGATNGLEAAITGYLTGSYDAQAAPYLAEVRANATTIESELNTVITTGVATARGAGVPVSTVPIDFSGHDMCQDYPGGTGGWVLGPSIQLSAKDGPATAHIKYSPTDQCVQFDAGCSTQVNKSGVAHKRVLGVNQVVSYALLANDNDFPHPDAAGQDAIATAIAKAR